MTTTLRVTREGVGIELRRGLFEISVDGRPVGSIELHQTVETLLDPGPHTLRIAASRYSSGDHAFDAVDGEVVSFQCHGAMVWPRYVASVFRPDLAISLKRR